MHVSQERKAELRALGTSGYSATAAEVIALLDNIDELAKERDDIDFQRTQWKTRFETTTEQRDEAIKLAFTLETERNQLKEMLQRVRDMDQKHLDDFAAERQRYEQRIAVAESKDVTKMRARLEQMEELVNKLIKTESTSINTDNMMSGPEMMPLQVKT